jgi:hypothetical protein
LLIKSTLEKGGFWGDLRTSEEKEFMAIAISARVVSVKEKSQENCVRYESRR